MARVLVVDDEPDILLMLRMNLEGAGHETVLAADGEMALQRVAQHEPDVVLLDVMMPVMDGWGVLESLGREGLTVPVIVVSAKSGERDARRAIELGAVDYVTKPFDIDRLLLLIEEHLRRTPAEREAHRRAVLRSPE